MEVGSELVEVVAVVADEVREAVGEGLSLAASEPVGEEGEQFGELDGVAEFEVDRQACWSTPSVSTRLDEAVEQGGAFGLSSFVGMVALPGEDG